MSGPHHPNEEALLARLAELEETLFAIRSGTVDAILGHGVDREGIVPLGSAERPYHVFVDSMAEGALTLSEDGTVLYANAAAGVILGQPLPAIVGRPLEALATPGSAERVRQVVSASRSAPERAEVELLTGDGGRVTVRLSARAAVVEGERYVFAVFTDLTDLMTANEAKVSAEYDAAERLRELDQLKDAFLAAMSHDVRTPLSAIRGFAQLLLDDDAIRNEPERFLAVDRIAANAAKISDLVTDLLDFDRATRGDMPSRREPVDVAALARDTVAKLDLQRPVDVDGDSLVFPVDRVQFERVIENLVLNADHYTPPASRVLVSFSLTSTNTLVLCVEDEGPGVPNAEKETIFEPFRRGNLRAETGSGLGLGVVAAFARLHGGRAWVEDREAGGARFMVSFAYPQADLEDAGDDVGFAEARLRDLQQLTDVSLGHLDVDDLLVELLHRVTAILDADTAAVLLLDERTQELVARAARGIEEEVRQGVRIPVGRGFAGRIAEERRPVIIDRVDETTVTNPLLWEAGIKAMLGVPLLTGGAVVGVLHVGTLGSRRFTQHDAELLQVVADRIAGAALARQLEVERAAAKALQRSLLPSALPPVPGLQFATRYLPAGGADLGGDWYDVFTVPSGEAWIVTGDVGGHGFRASVVMGRLRSAIRAYALEERTPEEVLDLADGKLQHFEPTDIATVTVATLSPPFDAVRIASAGHPPSILAMPGREPEFVPTDHSPPLGTPLPIRRQSTTIPFPPGCVLFLYTDGLVERRGESIDVGLERLRTTVRADDAEAVCRTVTARLLGETDPDDDVAMVTVRARPRPARD